MLWLAHICAPITCRIGLFQLFFLLFLFRDLVFLPIYRHSPVFQRRNPSGFFEQRVLWEGSEAEDEGDEWVFFYSQRLLFFSIFGIISLRIPKNNNKLSLPPMFPFNHTHVER